MRKSELPEKLCPTCNRNFKWRKKWEKNWADVKYCSKKCSSKKIISGRNGR
ncbi:DUF2256 domain-containing protein [Gammaproteobacteria bacterium]|nr:DUF2256 domain-containing protein [Gammaproteobacteria bacterium]